MDAVPCAHRNLDFVLRKQHQNPAWVVFSLTKSEIISEKKSPDPQGASEVNEGFFIDISDTSAISNLSAKNKPSDQ